MLELFKEDDLTERCRYRVRKEIIQRKICSINQKEIKKEKENRQLKYKNEYYGKFGNRKNYENYEKEYREYHRLKNHRLKIGLKDGISLKEVIQRRICNGIRLLFNDNNLIKEKIIECKKEKIVEHKKCRTRIKYRKCKRCGCKLIKYNKNRRHHIIPRKYKGFDMKENYIILCNKCHDSVEIMTEEWIQSGKHYDIDILKSMIINDGFE